jgi:hypothetical protein
MRHAGKCSGSRGLWATLIGSILPFVPLPPYALPATSFRFPALAALAGKAPLGGQREVTLAVYLAARLAQDSLPDRDLSPASRTERCVAAKQWLASVALPAPVRAPLAKLVDSSTGKPAAVAEALRGVMAVTADYLDSGARSELNQLSTALDAQALVG